MTGCARLYSQVLADVRSTGAEIERLYCNCTGRLTFLNLTYMLNVILVLLFLLRSVHFICLVSFFVVTYFLMIINYSQKDKYIH